MFRESVTQSDTILIMTLENLIAVAMGPPKENRINFKMFQTVLYLLAKQTRLLEKIVCITTEELGIKVSKSMKFDELDPDYEKRMKRYVGKRDKYGESSGRLKKGGKGKGFDDDEDYGVRGREKGGKRVPGKTGKMGRKRKPDDDDDFEWRRIGGRNSSESMESDEYDDATGKIKKGAGKVSRRGGESSHKGGADSDRDRKRRGGKGAYGSDDEDSEYDEVTGKRIKGEKRSRKGGKGTYGSDDEDSEYDEVTGKRIKGGKTSRKGKGRAYDSADDDDSKDEVRKGKEGKGRRGRGKGTAFDDSDEDGGKGQRGKGKGGAYDSDDEDDSDTDRRTGGRKQRGKGGRGYADEDDDESDDEDGPPHKIHRVGSIEVVTQSEFDQLQEAVRQMKRIKGPMPMPTMPESEELRKGILSGSSSVPETMNAMQITSRVEASEKQIQRMADLLTRLAASGILPPEINEMVNEAQEGADAVTAAAETYQYKFGDLVTQGRMKKGLDKMKTGLQKKMEELLQMIKTTNEQIDKDTHAIDKKLNSAMDVYDKVKELRHSMTEKLGVLTDYEKSIYDQVHLCKNDMDSLKIDLKNALIELNRSVANPETLAVKSLSNKYTDLVVELEHVLFNHSTEMSNQEELSNNLTALKKIVADLEEQKSQRDEVIFLLNKKACRHHLDGFIFDTDLHEARDTLTRRISTCHEKFIQLDTFWQAGAKDLRDSLKDKATLVQLWNERQEALKLLWQNEEKLRCLAYAIGEPALAILTNLLSENAFCGSCMVPAKMQTIEESYGQPPRLPKLRAKKGMLEIEEYVDPCEDFELPNIEDNRSHLCHRWVGGSHTLLDNASRLQKMKPSDMDASLIHYLDDKEDKQMFQLCTGLNQPCRQCNVVYEASEEQDTQPSHAGADHGEH